jgi:hypothetical protein
MLVSEHEDHNFNSPQRQESSSQTQIDPGGPEHGQTTRNYENTHGGVGLKCDPNARQGSFMRIN